eukprot:TRINITY_DN2014_c0_g1_i1.p1 TRINITY_DN2014_c0_g1~~TRINITY_DN2014_c0_g1_i1.p1  ORF type:complete len:238 (-),score=68.81 TRINITY_DN2014_c0_g1_i1:66-779(-)
MKNILKIVLLLIFIIANVFAQDAVIPVSQGQEQGELSGAKGVELYSIFPENQENFPAGKVHQFLTLFHNGAPEYMNVTYIEAQLVLPQDHSIFVQNFTKQPFFINVPPNAEVTIDYFWRADPNIEPMKLVFLATIHYRTTYGNSAFSTILYNRTIQITEPEEDIYAGESMFLYFLIIGTIAVGGYLYYMKTTSEKKQKTSKTTTSSVTESGTSEIDESWLTGTVATSDKKKNKKKNK